MSRGGRPTRNRVAGGDDGEGDGHGELRNGIGNVGRIGDEHEPGLGIDRPATGRWHGPDRSGRPTRPHDTGLGTRPPSAATSCPMSPVGTAAGMPVEGRASGYADHAFGWWGDRGKRCVRWRLRGRSRHRRIGPVDARRPRSLSDGRGRRPPRTGGSADAPCRMSVGPATAASAGGEPGPPGPGPAQARRRIGPRSALGSRLPSGASVPGAAGRH